MLLVVQVLLLYCLIKVVSTRTNSEIHESNVQFTFGTLVSNVMVLFDQMIKLYQEASNLEATKHRPWAEDHAIKDSLMAFSACQGLFSRIRLEKKLFEEVIQNAELEAQQKKEDKEERQKKNKVSNSGNRHSEPMTPSPNKFRGGKFVERRINIDDLFDENDFDNTFQIPILAKRSKENKKNYLKLKQEVEKKSKNHKSVDENPNIPQNPFVPKPDRYRPVPELDMSKFLKPRFPKHQDPNLAKLMSKLDADNPKLNPELNKYSYLPRSYKASDSDDSESDSYPRQSRRIGFDSRPKPKQRKSDRYTTSQLPKRFDRFADIEPQISGSNLKAPMQSRQHPAVDRSSTRAKKRLWSPKNVL